MVVVGSYNKGGEEMNITRDMTKGGLEVVHTGSVMPCRPAIIKGDSLHIIVDTAEKFKDPKYDAQAIVAAVNSTYGKGIDPGSVGELVKALEAIVELSNSIEWLTEYCLFEDVIDKAEEVLNKARIKE